MKKFLTTSLFVLCGGVICVFFTVNTYALTSYIGDVDGFGFSGATGYNGAYGGLADINGDGLLNSGDALPDLNGNGHLATGQGDDFDNRSDAEKNDKSGAQWTDVALSTSFSGRPGLAEDASFTFNFIIDPDDQFWGEDHFINLVYGDYDVVPMTAVVEGETVELLGNSDDGYLDGKIWRSYVAIDWEDMLDGSVTIDIIAPNEPYIAFDYVLLDTHVIPTTTPEPGALLLLGAGLMGIVGIKRRLKK